MVIPWPPKRDFLKTDNDPSTADVLKGTALFSALSDAELASLAKRTVIRSFASAELIFSEGEPCTGFYIVSRGRVRIFKISPGGREQVLALEGPGRSVGGGGIVRTRLLERCEWRHLGRVAARPHLGLLSTMVFAIGQRILPAFCGARVLYSPRLMLASLAALHIGCALRVASEIPAYEANVRIAWHVLPCSAVIELLAVSLFAANLAVTLLQPPAHLRSAVAIS